MKKLLTLTLLLSSLGLAGSVQAATTTTNPAVNNPQVRIRIGRRDRDRDRYHRHRDWDRAYGERVGYGRTFARDVRYGNRIYRETYQVRDGRTFLISRVRLY